MSNLLKNKTVVGLLLLLGLGGFYVFSCWYSVSENGSDFFYKAADYVIGILGIIILMAVLNMLWAFVKLISPKHRSQAWSDLKTLSKIFVVLFVLIIFALVTGGIIRDLGLRAMTARARPLIEAIKSYQATNGTAPESLNVLVPKYISNIPATKVGAYPKFDFVNNSNSARFGGNPWILFVPIDWDELTCEYLIYYPNQNYPRDRHGNVMVRKFGHWVSIEFTTSNAMENGFPASSDIPESANQ